MPLLVYIYLQNAQCNSAQDDVSTQLASLALSQQPAKLGSCHSSSLNVQLNRLQQNVFVDEVLIGADAKLERFRGGLGQFNTELLSIKQRLLEETLHRSLRWCVAEVVVAHVIWWAGTPTGHREAPNVPSAVRWSVRHAEAIDVGLFAAVGAQVRIEFIEAVRRAVPVAHSAAAHSFVRVPAERGVHTGTTGRGTPATQPQPVCQRHEFEAVTRAVLLRVVHVKMEDTHPGLLPHPLGGEVTEDEPGWFVPQLNPVPARRGIAPVIGNLLTGTGRKRPFSAQL